MAVAFPRTDIFSFVTFQPPYSFELAERQEFSRQANGFTRGKDIGEPLWRGSFKTTRMALDKAVEFEAMLRSLDGVIQAFEAYDIRRPFPRLAPGYAGGGAISALGPDNKSLRISGLTDSMILSVGDYFAYELGGIRRLHQVMEPVTASAGGLTPFVEVRPHFPPGMTAGLALNLTRASAMMSIEPGSIATEMDGPVSATVSFRAFQAFPQAIVFSPTLVFQPGDEGDWFDPSDLTRLWRDTAATIPVTAPNQVVARMDGQRGLISLQQATVASRPTYRTSGGLTWLEFDGVDDRLTATTLMALTIPAYMGIAASKAAENSSPLINLLKDGTNYFRLENLVSGTRVLASLRSTLRGSYSKAAIGGTFPTNTPKFVDSLASAGAFDLSFNGGALDPLAGGTAFVAGDTSAGHTLQLGPPSAGAAFNFYGGVVLPRDPGANRSKLATYFGAKAGLAI